MITVRMADINIGVKYRYPFTEEYLRAYRTESEPDFIIEVSDAELERESALAEEPTPYEYLEFVTVYRKIADKISEYDAAVFHGAVLDLDGKAYIITARSGVGKTTHIGLWLSSFDDVSVLNGDKPIIRVIDGVICACGTPYMGKEGYGKNAIRPLGGIAFLERDAENSYSLLTSEDAVLRFMGQIYMNSSSPSVITSTLRLADKIISEIPLYEFRCNMDSSAAIMAREAFTKNTGVN